MTDTLRKRNGIPIPLMTMPDDGDAAVPAAPTAPPREALLAISRISQEETNWCWAAVTLMAYTWFGIPSPLTLCGVVNEVAEELNCCPDPRPSGCNFTHDPDDILAGHGLLRNNAVYEHPLTQAEIERDITADFPFGAYLEFRNPGPGDPPAHLVMVTGFRFQSNGENLVYILDPGEDSPGDGPQGITELTFSELRHGYRDADWTQTYLF